MPTDIFPNDPPNVIVDKFLQAQDEVRVHYKPQPYDLGPLTIKVTDKNKPLAITGLDQNGKKVTKNQPDIMPSIRGTSAGRMTDQNPTDCGIFFIGPGCSLEMNGLRLIHDIPAYPAGSGHGSATVANLVDNTKESSLTITNCAIETNATTAINIRSDTDRGAVPVNKPVNHIKVCDCQVTGKINQGVMAGNYSSISLGFWGAKPLDMRNAAFEVSGCSLKSLVFGVAVWKVLSDSKSKFLVANNQVGPTSVGVSFLHRPNKAGEIAVFPEGEIDIRDNAINLAKYFDLPENAGEPNMGAAGIIVRASSIADKTTIKDNKIDMTQLLKPPVNYKYRDAVVYELIPEVAQPGLVKEVSCQIDHNTVWAA
jgi:hypothetical protein